VVATHPWVCVWALLFPVPPLLAFGIFDTCHVLLMASFSLRLQARSLGSPPSDVINLVVFVPRSPISPHRISISLSFLPLNDMIAGPSPSPRGELRCSCVVCFSARFLFGRQVRIFELSVCPVFHFFFVPERLPKVLHHRLVCPLNPRSRPVSPMSRLACRNSKCLPLCQDHISPSTQLSFALR